MNLNTLKISTLLLGLLLLFQSVSALADDDVSLSGTSPSTVVVGEKFKVRYTLDGAHCREITEGECDAVERLFGPSIATQQSHSITNGKVESSRSTTFEYIYRATKVGQYSIAPAQVIVDGKKYTSNIIRINVVENTSAANSSSGQSANSGSATSGSGSQSVMPQGEVPDIIVRQSLNKTKVYEGEAALLTTKIYTRVDLNSITGVTPPELQEFVTQDLSSGQLQFQRESVDGVMYQSATASVKAIIPQKNGTIKIDPIEYEFVVKQRTGRSSGGFFGGFFDDVQMVRRSVKSNTLNITVLPLPDGKPSGFSGGVGDFKFNVSVTPKEVETDEGVQVKVSVSGEGNLKLLSIPRPTFHSDFDTFDPSESNKLESTEKGYKGVRTAEYLIIPRVAGEFEIPEIRFTYFNPSTAKYVTLRQGPFAIKVTKSANSTGQNGVVGIAPAQGSAVVYTGRDLRYLHLGNEALQRRGQFFVFSALFFALCGVVVALFTATLCFFRKRRRDTLNADRVKMRRANKAARRRLKVAAKLIKEGKRDAFFDEVMRALWGYLSDKLTLPLSELTKDNAMNEMLRSGIDQQAASDFMTLLDECEFARYAPSDKAEPMEEVYRKPVEIISQTDGCVKK